MHLNPVAAELNAKITAKNNSKLKQGHAKPYHSKVIPPTKQEPKYGPPYGLPEPKAETNLLDLKLRQHPQHIADNADVESRLSASKISVSAFKSFHATQLPMAGPEMSPMLAMNLGRHLNYHHQAP
jgi:hypothetical protein